MSRSRGWTDDELRAAVAASSTLSQVLVGLGLRRGGASLVAVRNRMLQLGLAPPVPHDRALSAAWDADPDSLATAPARDRRTWTDEQLAAAVDGARSIAGVLRELGLKPGGSMYVKIKRRIADLGLSTGHFTGQGWTKGLQNPVRVRKRPLSEVLVRDSTYLTTSLLRERLIKEGLVERCCAVCGLTEWRGLPAPLQLDHINGDRTDNRLSNLRILCPNCHAQTDTWCGRNVGKIR